MKRSRHSNSLKNLAEDLVTSGRKQGADEVEVAILDGNEFSVDIRLGKTENLIEAGSRYVGFRIIKDNKTAFVTSSDLTKENLYRLVKNSVKRAAFGNPDEFAGLPPFSETEMDDSILNLFDPEIANIPLKKKIALAKETEQFALRDNRITNSHGANFETKELKTILANSNGFLKDYKETYCSLNVGLQAGETDNKVEDYWFSAKRHFKDLASPEEIAKKAVERTIRQLNPRKIKTQNVPVIFEPLMTSWLLGFLFACVSGVSIYQKSSFLTDKLGKKIGNDKITVIDDGCILGKFGSRPFDSEGVSSQKTIVIKKGVLKNYLCNTYAAKKLKLSSTGNADGSGVGPSNFFLLAGKISPEDIIASTEKGLILTRTIGHGLNTVTGDISRGAFGLWIEKGEVVYPVSEITISGNLGNILKEIESVGNDLELDSAISGPTIKIQELTVSGT